MNIQRDGVIQPFEKVSIGFIFSTRDGQTYIKTYDARNDRHAATNMTTGALCVFDDEQEVCTVHPHAVLVVNGLQEPAWVKSERVRMGEAAEVSDLPIRYFIPVARDEGWGDSVEGVGVDFHACFVEAGIYAGNFYSSSCAPIRSEAYSIRNCEIIGLSEITLSEALSLSSKVKDFKK